MTEQRERMEKALSGCAEIGVPDTVDLWPGIRERVDGRALAQPRGPARSGLLRRTRVRWILAALAALILSTGGAYAARDLLYETFQEQLPGAGGAVYGKKLNMTQTAGGARVALGWAYADERFVVVGFDVEDLKGGRRVAGQPADLRPVQIAVAPGRGQGMERKFPERVDLTDGSGAKFWSVGGQQSGSVGPENTMVGPTSNSAVFEAEGRIQPGQKHRFRLKVPLVEEAVAAPAGERWPDPEPVGEPFVFDFEVPVRPVSVAKVDEKATASGITLTLERVSNSPGRPEAVVCFAPPDDNLYWSFWGEEGPYEGGPVTKGSDCQKILLHGPLEGRSSVVVTQIEGIPPCPSGNDEVCREKERAIRGPWRFEFEAPGP